ncbi:MAG TPA: glycosyltransferase [Bryobacteraceae bacterium]|nr:glycosyltransferase [Bryobacteraceae bacterium]
MAETLGRIAYLISQYPAYNHTFILREVRQLRALGWDIQTISIRAADRPVNKLTPEEADEHARTLFIKSSGPGAVLGAHLRTLFTRPLAYIATLLYALRMGHGGWRKLLYFAEAVVAGSWAAGRGYQHMHVHFASTVSLLVGKLFPIKVSVTIHGPDEFVDPAGFCLREKVESCAFIVAISQYARSQLMRYSSWEHWDKLEVCRLGIDPDVFQRQKQANADGAVRLICVARLAPVKGQHVLVDAVNLLQREGLRVELCFVGDGPDRPGLERHVRDLGLQSSVVFEGWCNQDRVRALYAATDIFVLASFAEGIPVVLMEAMAMEIPCVATNITGVPELISDNVNGFLVTPSDERQLADSIARLIHSPELRESIGRSGREKVIRDFHLANNVHSLSGIFQRRLGGARASEAVRASAAR